MGSNGVSPQQLQTKSRHFVKERLIFFQSCELLDCEIEADICLTNTMPAHTVAIHFQPRKTTLKQITRDCMASLHSVVRARPIVLPIPEPGCRRWCVKCDGFKAKFPQQPARTCVPNIQRDIILVDATMGLTFSGCNVCMYLPMTDWKY
jgi:hypothetical protein